MLQHLGLRRQPTPTDGACQFHAVSAAVGEDAETVRGNAIEYIRQNPADFQDFLETPLEEYTKRMSRHDEWGDHVTLVAIAGHYQRPVRVISDREDQEHEVAPPRFDPTREENPIFVLFHAEVHYEAAVQDPSTAARAMWKRLLQRLFSLAHRTE